MANNDKAFGLRPLGNLSGTGAQKQYGYEIADNHGGPCGWSLRHRE
jgi:hypothetical protein